MREDWVDVAIAALLRTGVLLSVGIVTLGIAVTFVHHPDYFSSRPAVGALTRPGTQFPNNVSAVIGGVRDGRGQAIVMAGLLLLIATPIARVALSIVVFAIEGDRLYLIITAAVLGILLVGFLTGTG